MITLRRIALIVGAFLVIVIATALEACNWSTGPIRSIHTSTAGEQIATVTHGFSDRRTYVFDEGTGAIRKPIFAFNAYDGPFTLAWDTTGRYFQFRRGSSQFTFDLKAHRELASPPKSLSFSPFLSASHEPDGDYLWFIQSLRYRTN